MCSTMEMEFVHTTCIYCGTGSIFYLVYLAGDEVFNLLNHCIKGMPFSSIHAYKEDMDTLACKQRIMQYQLLISVSCW